MRAASPALPVTDGQRQILERLAVSQSAPHREVTRAKALLMAEQGLANTAIAASLGVSPSSVVEWRKTFVAEGMTKFGQVHSGRGRKPTIPEDKIDEIVRLTKESKPPGETHWSCRSMAKAVGVSPATVQRVWSARGLKPHLVKTFKLSNDPKFEENSSTWSVFISTRRTRRWCCVWTKNRRCRPWSALRRHCPSRKGGRGP